MPITGKNQVGSPRLMLYVGLVNGLGEVERRSAKVNSIIVSIGRGSKGRIVPIKEVASNLSLPIHEIDTFTGWTVRVSYYFKALQFAHSVSSQSRLEALSI